MLDSTRKLRSSVLTRITMSCKPKATPGPKPPRQAQRPTADSSHFTPKVSRSFTAQSGEPSLWASTSSSISESDSQFPFFQHPGSVKPSFLKRGQPLRQGDQGGRRRQAKCWHNPKLAPYLKDIEVMTFEWFRKVAVVQIRK